MNVMVPLPLRDKLLTFNDQQSWVGKWERVEEQERDLGGSQQ